MTASTDPLVEQSAVGAQPLLQVSELAVEFDSDHGVVQVTDGVSFTVDRGETVGLTGESGSGKTVTGLAVMGLVGVSGGRVRGSVRVGGREIVGLADRRLSSMRGREMAMVFQEPRRSLDPAFTVGDQIAEVARRHLGLSRRDARARAVQMLDLVEIPSPAKRTHEYPHTFSGGMCQRVMIAMALAANPKLLIADEPTTALDTTTQAVVLELLRSLRDRLGLGMIFITHDLGVIANMADRVLVMYAGQVIEETTVDGLVDNPQHPYTAGLVGALPDLRSGSRRLAAIPGTVPPPHEFPAGCRFNPRCAFALDRCVEESPALVATEPRHRVRCVRVGEIELRKSLA